MRHCVLVLCAAVTCASLHVNLASLRRSRAGYVMVAEASGLTLTDGEQQTEAGMSVLPRATSSYAVGDYQKFLTSTVLFNSKSF